MVQQAVAIDLEFGVEPFEVLDREARDLFIEHWRELALDKQAVPLDIDYLAYYKIEEAGKLHVVTARSEGMLVGYYIATMFGHLHYRNLGDVAYTDVYYLAPEYRKGRNGVQFLQAIETSLARRGARKLYFSCKVHQDHTKLMSLMGWTHSDNIFTKLVN